MAKTKNFNATANIEIPKIGPSTLNLNSQASVDIQCLNSNLRVLDLQDGTITQLPRQVFDLKLRELNLKSN